MKALLRPGVFGIVLALHIAALYLLLNANEEPVAQPQTVIVTMLAPPAVQAPPVTPRQAPKPVRMQAPQQTRSEATPTPAAAAEAAPAKSETRPEQPQASTQPLAPAQPPAQPLALPGELSVSCPERTAPAYPAQSLRLGEQGRAVLRVELDENGRVSGASVQTSSGYARLDQAALNAVKTWRCKPALREGRTVPAVALQPFSFTLEDR